MKNKVINALKNMKKNFFSTRYLIVILGIIIVLKTILFYKNTVFFADQMWFYTVRQSLFFIVILLFPALFIRKPKWRFVYLFLVDIIISVLLFADEMYYKYASSILSIMQARKFKI